VCSGEDKRWSLSWWTGIKGISSALQRKNGRRTKAQSEPEEIVNRNSKMTALGKNVL
jgi:hypothetical protein